MESSPDHGELGFPKRLVSRRLTKRGLVTDQASGVSVPQIKTGSTQSHLATIPVELRDSTSQLKITSLAANWGDGYGYPVEALHSVHPQIWIPQATQGKSSEIHGGFEARVNHAMHSKDVTCDLLNRHPVPPSFPKAAITQMIKKSVSTVFNKDGKSGKSSKGGLDMNSSEKKESRPPLATRRNAHLRPLMLDGACGERVKNSI